MSGSFAYFILVHHKPDQFAWLMRAIYTPDDLFLVHVDLKSRLGLKRNRRGLMREVRRICAGRPNIVILPSRFTNWGGWSLSRILIDAIRIAHGHAIRWSHFINLSGQCYPLKSIAEIKREIGSAGDVLHVEMRPIRNLPEDDWHHRWSPMLETPLRVIKLPGRKRAPQGFRLDHKGSQWVILPRAFCAWLIDAPVTGRIARYMRSLLLSDELVMQALAANGPWVDRIAPFYGREIVWPGPKVLTGEDLSLLLSGRSWFGRKFDVEVDAAVLTALARRGVHATGPLQRGINILY